MVELLGIFLALALLALGALVWRMLRWLRRGLWRLACRVGGRAAARPSRQRKGGPSVGSAAGRPVLRLLLGPRRAARRLPALRGTRLRMARALSRRQAERIAALATELERTRRALRLAETARAQPGRADDRFRRAKQAFAVQFHPDRLRCPEPERSLRIGIFQQFWQELRRIERG